MLIFRPARLFLILIALAVTANAGATEDIAKERNELMKGVRDATKPVGAMLKGEMAFDAAKVQESLAVYTDASQRLDELVPAGSEGGEAAPAVWEDPDGFAATLQKWSDAITAAVEANPQDLATAKPVLGPVLNSCKGCHDSYRIDDD
jgi:cytochrome c556